MGLAQNLEGLHGEAEPRLTSGGEAATLPTKGLLCKALLIRLRSKAGLAMVPDYSDRAF
jgi:hypothetical protein